MNTEIVDRIKSYGYEVYMLGVERTWLFFTDGYNIGYLQYDKMCGFSLSTVHRPDNNVGTGYNIDERLNEAELTKEKLTLAFTHAPAWARDTHKVVKYLGIQDFLKSDTYNNKYKKV